MEAGPTCPYDLVYGTTYNVVVSVETSHYVVPYVSFTVPAHTYLTQVQCFSVACTGIHTFYNAAEA